MSVIKKSDIKDYLSSRHYTGIHLYRPGTQPDATGFPGKTSGHADSNTGRVVEETLSQPRFGGRGTSPKEIESVSTAIAAPAIPKSARA